MILDPNALGEDLAGFFCESTDLHEQSLMNYTYFLQSIYKERCKYKQ